RFERLEGHLQLVGGLLAAIGLLQRGLIQPGELVAGVGASVEDVVALLLDGRRVGHQDRHRGQEHTGGLASGARAHETPYGLCEDHGVPVEVAYTPTASRGTSTPSETMRTATIHRSSEAENSSIRCPAPTSSDSTTVGACPLISSSVAA